jgi:hypothetical protein
MKKNIFYYVLILLLTSCTRTFFILNESYTSRKIRVLYNNYSDSNRLLNRFLRFSDKNIIDSINISQLGIYFSVTFNLKSKKVLPLVNILREGYPETQRESSFFLISTDSIICSSGWDTVLCRNRSKYICNKFSLSSKLLSFAGKTNYIYKLE